MFFNKKEVSPKELPDDLLKNKIEEEVTRVDTEYNSSLRIR